MDISARNQLRGKVSSVKVDGIMAEVVVRVGDNDIVAVITKSSCERLGLKEGADATIIMKATEVMIGR